MVGIPPTRAVEKVKNNSSKSRMSLGQLLRACALSTDLSNAHREACRTLICTDGVVPGVPLFTAGDVTNWGLYRRNRTSYTPLCRLHCGHDSDHIRPGSATWGLLDKCNEFQMKDEHWLGTTAVYYARRCRWRPFAIHRPGNLSFDF